MRRFDARTYACCTKYSKGVGWGDLKFVLSAASFVTSTGGERILNTSRILPAWIGCPCVCFLCCVFGEGKATSSKTWLLLVMSKMSYTRLYNCSEFSKLNKAYLSLKAVLLLIAVFKG